MTLTYKDIESLGWISTTEKRVGGWMLGNNLLSLVYNATENVAVVIRYDPILLFEPKDNPLNRNQEIIFWPENKEDLATLMRLLKIK